MKDLIYLSDILTVFGIKMNSEELRRQILNQINKLNEDIYLRRVYAKQIDKILKETKKKK